MEYESVIQVLDDPLARQLMSAAVPVRMAYTGSDGSPRVVPLGFHWNGAEFIICTLPHAPKVRALSARPNVALTIDTNSWPPHVLLVRGTASLAVVDGVPPEYFEASRKLVDPNQWDAFQVQVRSLYQQMARIAIVPHWAKLLDFETRLPMPIEQLLGR